MRHTVPAAGALGLLAAGGCAWAAMWPTSQLFGRTFVRGTDPAQIALTFDDGPNAAHTPALLDVLARHGVHATFFMIGRFARRRPEIVRAVRRAGHAIGNHTDTHPVLLFERPSTVRAEIERCQRTLEDILGERVRLFRPPHGARRPDVLHAVRAFGLAPVMWNVAGNDWSLHTADAVERKALRGIRAAHGAVNLLLHDGGHQRMGVDRGHTVAAVDRLIARCNEAGRRFVTIPEMMQARPRRRSALAWPVSASVSPG